MISAEHPAIGFSSVDTIRCSSGWLELSPVGGRSSCWYAVDSDRQELVSTVSRTEKPADANGAADAALVGSGRRKRRLSAAASANFENRFQELLEFKKVHGHTRVPRRNGKLGDWVNKLRQRKDRLDEQRLVRLDEIGFCWDASDDRRRKELARWWERLELFREIQQQQQQTIRQTKETPVDTPLSPSVASRHQQSSVLSFDALTDSQKKWLRRQRIEYVNSDRKPSPRLDETQIQALNEIDPNWWKMVSSMMI